MTRAERARLKWAVNGGGLVWLLLMGWLMIATLPEDAIQNHGTSQIKDRMDNCAGTFSERFECKERIIVASGRETFYITALRFLLVIVPPLVASGWLSNFLRRQPLTEAPRSMDDGDWKARAQMHTEVPLPEVAHALHMSDGDLPPLADHPGIADIAPLEDWKARATKNTSRGKE